MPIATLPASPPDISAILTSLGVFSLAIAAVVGGVYKGIKEVKKGGSPTDKELAGGLILDTASARALTESNSRLNETNREMLDILRQVDHRIAGLSEALGDHRTMTRSHIEDQHRLRAAIVDLYESLRRIRS